MAIIAKCLIKYFGSKLRLKKKLVILHQNLPMKKIEAVIRKSKFSELKKALHAIDVNFFTYWDVTGIGNERTGMVYRGVSYSTSDIQRRYLSIVVSDNFEEITIQTIIDIAKTGEVGDGKIFVSDIQETYRIRTGDKGSQTLG